MTFLSRLFTKAPTGTPENGATVRPAERTAEEARKPSPERPQTLDAAADLSFGEPLLTMAFEPGAQQRQTVH